MAKLSPSSGTSQSTASSLCDDTLRQFAGYNAKRAANIIFSDLSLKLKPLNLKLTTFSALVLIVDNPGVRQSQLADSLMIERPNFVAIIDDLERRELITRQRDEKDRRAFSFNATQAGQQLYGKAIDVVQTHEDGFLTDVSDVDKKQLIASLQLVESALFASRAKSGNS